MNEIVRPLTADLGFDEFGQLVVCWYEGQSKYSTIINDVRGKKCCICGREWELTAASFRNQMHCHYTDEWCHRTCMTGHIAMTEADKFYAVLCDARGPVNIAWKWVKIPNEYAGGWKTSWYRVSFKGYAPTVKIGARKRVYHMSMHDLRVEQVNSFLPLVVDEDVTKGTDGDTSVYIHAHNEGKMTEYMRHFYTILQMDKPIEDITGIIARLPEKTNNEGQTANA